MVFTSVSAIYLHIYFSIYTYYEHISFLYLFVYLGYFNYLLSIIFKMLMLADLIRFFVTFSSLCSGGFIVSLFLLKISKEKIKIYTFFINFLFASYITNQLVYSNSVVNNVSILI